MAKLYQIIFSFDNPTQAVASIQANSEEEVIEKLAEYSGIPEDRITIDDIQELAEVPDDMEVENKKGDNSEVTSNENTDEENDNVIPFPTSKTVH